MRILKAMGFSVLAALAGSTMSAEAAYPERPVTLIVAWPAGGATDLTARALQEQLSKAIGGQIVIKNVVGASGTIGTAEAAQGAPDGYTILVSPIGPMVIQTQRMKLTYGVQSFEPVCKITDSPVVLMAPPKSRFKTAKDVVAEAKAQDGKLAYASSGPGTIPHMSMIAFGKVTGTKLKHVPYKGSAEVVQSMLAGTIEIYSDQPNLVPQYDLTPLASMSEKRLPAFPNLPTLKEAGFDLVFSIWNGMFAPKGTPAAVLDKLEAACRTTMSSDAVKTALEKQRQPIDFLDRKAFGTFVEREYGKARAVLEEAGLLSK